MYENFQKHLQATLQEIKEAGLYKNERVIITPQSSGIQVEGSPSISHEVVGPDAMIFVF